MKSDFKGNGPMKDFVDASNRVFAALTNARVDVPPGFEGTAPEFKLNEGKDSASFELKMNDAVLLNRSKVYLRINGNPQPVGTYSVYTSNGKLIIRVPSV